MDYSETIRLSWDKETNTGAFTLFLQMDILRKYALPLILNAYKQGISVVEYPIVDIKAYEDLKLEILSYQDLLKGYELSSESKFHHSNILYLIIDHKFQQSQAHYKQELKRKIYNRVYVLKHLMKQKTYDLYDVKITGKIDGFKYQFQSDANLKAQALDHLVTQAIAEVRSYDIKLYRLLNNDASEDELESAINRVSNHKIEKMLVAELAKRIVTYLSHEVTSMNTHLSSNKSSISNSQGDFVYDLLTMYKIYQVRQHSKENVVNHHDTIRKLIKRSAL